MFKDLFFNITHDEWTQPALASCQILKWIGIYLCFAFICGIGLNAIILIILLQNKRCRSPIDIFIIALSFADLLDALLGIPLSLTSNLACRWLYGKYLCYYEGFITYFVGMVGLYLLTALSLNRYWKIVIPTKEQYVTYRTAYISVILSVLGGLFWALPPVFGWNNYRLEGARTTCSICWQDRSINVLSYNVFMFIFAYIIPLIIMVYCNTCIYLKVREASRTQMTWNTIKGLSKSGLKKQNMEKRMAKTVFFIIVSFTIAWTPYAIVAFISSFFSPDLIPPLGGTLPAIFAKSSIYFNPFVYIASNSYIRSRIFISDSLKETNQQSLSLKQLEFS
ncbi:unnamed protein product [Rotaria sp. Silwood1]|nr:unnamed protein product [Rotaria sp. Silwood1]CAF3324444.1 unnamed protein product [Rotaria sp. Silwood1]CAF4584959.1 unnamed protein product [Rotaria sp. Silwood1]CAF4620105.1 unnamed protein product [Rotaria sp. Silwood1]